MLNSPDKINKRIAQYRNLAGYTQERAAIALGMNKNAYARMERSGTPKPEMLKKLSELFNVSAQVLLYGEISEISYQPEGTGRTVLHESSITFKAEEPLILTANERNAVKLCRTLTPEQRSELLKLIADYVDSTKPED